MSECEKCQMMSEKNCEECRQKQNITREESIKAIQDFIGWFKPDSRIYKALYLAIQTLSQEPCSDAVSREDVLAEITRFSTEEGASVECQQLYCDVNNMPSVTHKSETVTEFADRCRECGARYGKLLKQKSGKWIELPKAFDTNENPCKCSACGHILSFMHCYPKSNYCPNCGADMRGAE